VGFWFLVILTVLVTGVFARELWRAAAPGLRARRRRAKLEGELERRTESALDAPGATPERAVVLPSASVVEVRAASESCPVCGERSFVERHVVETFGGRALRVVWLKCKRCGHRRPFYAQIDAPVVN